MHRPFIIYTAVLFLLVSCKKDKPFEEKEDPPIQLEVGQSLIEGRVDLSGSLAPSQLNLVTNSGTFPIKEDGTYRGASYDLPKQLTLLENKQGEILLASLDHGELSARSTAKAIVSLMPWTAFVPEENLDDVLQEVLRQDGVAELETAITAAVSAGQSPFADEGVINALASFGRSLFAQPRQAQALMSTSIPEIDFLVTPTIDYQNGELIIKTDPYTTATWGVGILLDNEPVTDYLPLQGNTVSFPGFSSLVNLFSGKENDAIFQTASPLAVPLSAPAKYSLRFRGPASKEILTSPIARLATQYTVRDICFRALQGLGIPLKNECYASLANKLLGSVTDILSDPNAHGETFLLNYLYNRIKESAGTIVECMVTGDGPSGRDASKTLKYVGAVFNFLDIYGKAEASYAIGKLVGDMYLLNDFDLCRQVVDGKLYPCFTLVKDENLEKKDVVSGESMELSVGSREDFPIAGSQRLPVGATVTWTARSGSDELFLGSSAIEQNGKATVSYVPLDKGEHLVKASVGPQDFVEYKLNVVEDIDSTAIYERAVLGGWTVSTYESGESYRLVLNAGGRGAYRTSDGTEYPITWWITKRDKKYYLFDSGFWHRGFNEFRRIGINMNENLTYPVSSFDTYSDFGDGKFIKSLHFAR